jgi:hypothetical protein
MALRRKFVGVAKPTDLAVTFRVSRDKKGNVITSSHLDTVISLTGNLVVPAWDVSMQGKTVAEAGQPTQYIEFELVDTEQK